MERFIKVITKRTKFGTAMARVCRFMNYSTNKINYSFKLFNTYKFFNTYKELKDFIESNYELYDGELPEKGQDFFK